MQRPENVGDLSPSEWERFDALLERFEKAWRELGTADLAKFLPTDHLRPLALRELIKSELEIRWRRGQRVLVEEYLARFPELKQETSWLPLLLYEEYVVRRRHGDRPEVADYRERFPDHFSALAQRLRDDPPLTKEKQAPPPPPPPPPPPEPPAALGLLGPPNRGDVLPVGGGYKLLKRLGVGSFGEVWQSEAPGGVEVALKIIHRPLDHEEAQRELQALELIKNLRHPFLLQTQAFWALQDRLVIAMELAEGCLRDRLKECVSAGHLGVPVEELLGYLRETSEALDFLHAKGILHRDIKPENILLVGRHAMLADLGLARHFGAERSVQATLCGSAPYMAPEIWRGRASASSDQYSLASTYAELRLNRPLFPHRDMLALMCDHATVQPDLTPLPDAEIRVLLRALHKESGERFGSCLEFCEALERAVGGEAPAAEKGTVAQVAHTAVKTPLEPIATPPLARTLAPARTEVFEPVAPSATESVYVTIHGSPETSLHRKPEPAEKPAWKSAPTEPRRRRSWSGLVLCLVALGMLAGMVLFAFSYYLPFRPHETTSSASSARARETGAALPGDVVLPTGTKPAEGATLRTVGEKRLYDRITCTLPNGTPVLFLLLAPPDGPKDLPPFYIMQTKVTNRMFSEFAQARADIIRNHEWRKGGIGREGDLGSGGPQLDYPVYRVRLDTAHEFALWLGELAGWPATGELPTTRQWDTAGGRYVGKPGPFDDESYRGLGLGIEWQPGDFALGRDFWNGRNWGRPMPSGTAYLDQSCFSCRDMAANGREWTSSIARPVAGNDDDPPVRFGGPVNLKGVDVALRSSSYHVSAPFIFSLFYQSQKALEGSDDISFRVVLNLPPLADLP